MIFSDSEIAKGYYIKEGENGVIQVIFTRATETNEESIVVAESMANDIQEILTFYQDHEALILVELTNDNGGDIAKPALMAYKSIIDDPRIMRMAIYGGLPRYRNVAKLLLPLLHDSHIKVFKDKPSALQWLIST